MTMEQDRLMIFIDGQNLMHGAQNFGVQVDSVKLVEALSEGRKLKRATTTDLFLQIPIVTQL